MVAKPGRPTVSSSNPDADLTTRPVTTTLKSIFALTNSLTSGGSVHLAVIRKKDLK
jgi:hypothetical protein